MIRSPRFLFVVLFALASFATQASAQSSNLQYQVANLVEDQRLILERMRGLLSEMDELRRENAQLKAMVEDYQGKVDRQSDSYATVGQVNELVRKTVSALEARDEVLRKELVVVVDSKLEAFGKTVNKALNSVPAMEKPDPQVKTEFDTSDVPRTGTPYTVQPGDNIASIAKKLNSRIDWIQNINKISDPRLLQVGQVIFVPQKSQ